MTPEETVDIDDIETQPTQDFSFKESKRIKGNEEFCIDDYIKKIEDDFSTLTPKINNVNYLGEGHFGYVFYAKRQEKDVAIKIIKPSWINLDHDCGWDYNDINQVKQNFILECGMQRILSDIVDGVVKLYEGSEHKGNWYMITELMNRHINLDIISEEYRNFKLKDRVEMMEKVTKIVYDIHKVQFHNDCKDKGFVHRDLKPQNILFTRDTLIDHTEEKSMLVNFLNPGWDLKITDFGLIRRIRPTNSSDEGHIVGTPYFMSPEQITRPEEVDHRTDIYSLGATFYILCNNSYHRNIEEKFSPNDFKNLAELKAKPFDDPNKKISRLNHIIMKCLDINPDRRYQSAKTLYNDLRDYRENI